MNRKGKQKKKTDEDNTRITNICNSEPSELLSRIIRGDSRQPVSTVLMLAARECNLSGRGRFSASENSHISRRFLPIYRPKIIDTILGWSPAFNVSQFSTDGSLLVCGFQTAVCTSPRPKHLGNFHIRNVDGGWRLEKKIKAKRMHFVITDASLSLDNRFLVYSSCNPLIHIVDVTSDETHSSVDDTDEPTEFHRLIRTSTDNRLRIYSVKFSTDGRQFVAGSTDNSIRVYDLESEEFSTRILHTSVNSACFADESGQIIFSGGDDGLVKVWDRRQNPSSGREVTALSGHLERIAFVNSRGDGRHLISNGKDQVIKLWDIRKATATTIGLNRTYGRLCDDYPMDALNDNHPNDLSLTTYRGHSIKYTHIRCYFSPPYSTGQRYIYTGSSDKCVYIYDVVSGAQVAKLEHHMNLVRDCTWHPKLPLLVSSSWDGTVARWEFPEDQSERPAEVLQ